MTYYINEFCIIIAILQHLVMFSINLGFLVSTVKYYMHIYIYMFAFSILIIISTLIMDSTTIIKKHAQIVEHAHAK